MGEHLNGRQQQFVREFNELVGRFTDVLGPVIDDDREPQDGKAYAAAELAEMSNVDHPMLQEWILMTAWSDLDTGDSYTSAFTVPGMPNHHRLGMLYTWLSTWS